MTKTPSGQYPDHTKVSGVPQGTRWIDDYLAPRDEQLRALTEILQGQVGTEQLNWEPRTLEVEDLATLTVKLQRLKGKALGAIVIGWSHSDTVALKSFATPATDEVAVSFRATNPPAGKYTVTLLVLGS